MIEFSPIGIIHTPWKKEKDCPIQPTRSGEAVGTIEIFPEFVIGLKDLDGFSHIHLIFHFHKSKGFNSTIKPYLDTVRRGVFACRAPRRPNQIGLSIVRLVKIEGNLVYIKDADMLDGTPLLDIKPYIPDFDIYETEKNGWIGNKTDKLNETISDKRFN